MSQQNDRSKLAAVWPVLIAVVALAAGYGARGAEGAELDRRVSRLEESDQQKIELATEVAALRASTEAQLSAVQRELEQLRAQLAQFTQQTR